jgi:hypothetical protein
MWPLTKPARRLSACGQPVPATRRISPFAICPRVSTTNSFSRARTRAFRSSRESPRNTDTLDARTPTFMVRAGSVGLMAGGEWSSWVARVQKVENIGKPIDSYTSLDVRYLRRAAVSVESSSEAYSPNSSLSRSSSARTAPFGRSAFSPIARTNMAWSRSESCDKPRASLHCCKHRCNGQTKTPREAIVSDPARSYPVFL